MATAALYPVRVDADLEPGLSRWLWLVKWILAIPHYVVLAFLWSAFTVLSVLAFFAILFTGRYPPGIFAFNVGVMRWSWRVAYYAYGALGTDRYPPFTLEDVPDYPAHLEIAYPQRLSRGLVLVKWWLLAIPHYVIVALLAGGTWFFGEWAWGGSVGVIGVLVLAAAVVLAATGRYPAALFDVILGMNRWVLRVAGYAGLMTDEYPPFRLDLGGHEEEGTLTVPAPAAPGARAPGWTGGRVVSVIAGSIIAMGAFGVFTGGGVALWADRTLRDDAGYLTSSEEELRTGGYAVVSEDISIEVGGADVAQALLGDVRVRVTPIDPSDRIFVGIARTADVRSYLDGVDRTIVEGFRFDVRSRALAGGAPAGPPGSRPFWAESSEGTGTRTIDWEVRSGSWTIVAMDAGGARGVDVTADVGATIPALPWVAVAVLALAAVLLVVGVVLIVVPVRRAGANPRGGAAS